MHEYLGVHGTGLDHCMHCVFHICDCMIVCYTLRGKLIHGILYMGNVIAWLFRGKIICMTYCI